jgi:hypothetical protein
LSSLPVAGCTTSTGGTIFKHRAGQNQKTPIKTVHCAKVRKIKNFCEWYKRFVNKQKITLIVKKKRGERVRVKQRGWDALNRTQTARSYSSKHSQFIFVSAENQKILDSLTKSMFNPVYSTVRISGPPSVT